MSTLTYDVAAVRRDFPIFETGIAYLDSANTSQRPRQVTDAMLDYFTKFNSNIHRAAYRIAEEATVRYEATREKVRALINAASTKEIVYVRGTTEAINLVAYTTRTSSRGRSWPQRRVRRSSTSTSTSGASCGRTSTPNC
jgi:cysteine desulfurase/selenocysteine lyase